MDSKSVKKNKIGSATYLYPMPTTIVGANVSGKANFLPIAYCGIVQHSPAMISVTLGKRHYTNAGVKENQTFSVNIPSCDMVEVTDYLGLHSGRDMDKSALFKVFYGELKSAPMIQETPLNLECRLVKTLDFGGTNEIFIGEIVQAYACEDILSAGLPDIQKLNPIIFSMHDNSYWSLGNRLGKAWSIGNNFLKKKEKQ
jgi:flavin reductase (DIM6/NTAB) family NADH-FMN oxidoreductase RutF